MRALRLLARLLRQIAGAPDYERYREHHARLHPGRAPLTPRQYYAEFIALRYAGGRGRCC